MEKAYFTTLAIGDKTELAWNYGEEIVTVATSDRYISLYLLDTFFVEIHIHKSSNELLEIGVQDDLDVLYAFVSHLDISDVWTQK